MKRDYSKNKRSNLLFKKREKKLRAKNIKTKIKLVIVFLFFSIIIIGIFYFIYGGSLKVVHIEIKGNQRVESSEILSFINNELNNTKLFFPSNNYLFIKEKKISQKIKENFHLQEVDGIKIFPDKLSFTIIERSPRFIIKINNTDYFLDKNGVIIREIIKENNKLIHITDTSDIKLLFNYPLFSTKEINYFHAITDYLSKTDYRIKTLEKNKFNGLTVIMDNDFKIYFNLNEDIQKQIDKLNSILKKNKENTEYIDVRFSNKVYYK